DREFSLRRDIDEFGASAARQRCGHFGAGVEELVLGRTITHRHMIGSRSEVVKSSNDYLTEDASPTKMSKRQDCGRSDASCRLFLRAYPFRSERQGTRCDRANG